MHAHMLININDTINMFMIYDRITHRV